MQFILIWNTNICSFPNAIALFYGFNIQNSGVLSPSRFRWNILKNSRLNFSYVAHELLSLQIYQNICVVRKMLSPSSLNRTAHLCHHPSHRQSTSVKALVRATTISFDFNVLLIRSKRKLTTFGRTVTPCIHNLLAIAMIVYVYCCVFRALKSSGFWAKGSMNWLRLPAPLAYQRVVAFVYDLSFFKASCIIESDQSWFHCELQVVFREEVYM